MRRAKRAKPRPGDEVRYNGKRWLIGGFCAHEAHDGETTCDLHTWNDWKGGVPLSDVKPTGRREMCFDVGGYNTRIYPDGGAEIGCQSLSPAEFRALWKKIGRYLGYEITG